MMKLTALIPAHNDAYTLRLCLRSIVKHFDEILVLDDCSTDGTRKIVTGFAAHHKHLRLIRQTKRQLGWIEARKRLHKATDSDYLFWIDADDVLCECNAHLLRRIAASDRPVVRLQLCEMWGDLEHTTQRLRHYDKCHIFVNRGLADLEWRGGSTAKPQTSVAIRPGLSEGPLFFHIKGVKPDRRLVERQWVRKWLRAAKPTATVEEWDRFANLHPDEIHRRAIKMLLRSRQDKIRKTYPQPGRGVPPRPKVLREAPVRFEMVYQDGILIDRIDREV